MIDWIEQKLGFTLKPEQLEAIAVYNSQTNKRLCLFYKTGAGKTATALAALAQDKVDHVLVIAPPVTQDAWVNLGRKLDMEVTTISHAKFRQTNYKIARNIPIIVDEFHLLGGHGGVGWKKLDRLARGLQAPLLILSATPQYNDADRVYCVQHVLDPLSVRGGFIAFLYEHCTTEENPFGRMPNVTGFKNYPSAEEYLAALPQVCYIPDDAQFKIVDIDLPGTSTDEFERYNLNRRTNRIMASLMEKRHAQKYLNLIGDDGLIRPHIYDQLTLLVGDAVGPVLLYCNSAQVAGALDRALLEHNVESLLLDGSMTTPQKDRVRQAFLDGAADVLVGTATMATGLDGLDKICDTLVILDDTDDPSLRRQLIGRILPRGYDQQAKVTNIYRLNFLV